MTTLSTITIAFSAASLCFLAALHFVSPEFAPSWRMISEYALGRHKWLITGFFVCWAVAGLALTALLATKVSGPWAVTGVVLLGLSAIGALMGGLFDIQHKLHGLAFGIGVPTLPVAALLIGYHLSKTTGGGILVPASHAPWISLVLMGVAMGVMIAGFKKAGIAMGPDVTPPSQVPAGVVALAGYANRLLVVCYIGWLIVTAAALRGAEARGAARELSAQAGTHNSQYPN